MSRLKRLRRFLVIVGVVVVVDALVYGLGGLTFMFAIPIVLAVLIIAGLAAVRRDPERAKLNLLRAGVWVAAAVLASAITAANSAISERRAHQVIAAVRAYEARHQRLPDRLEALVPDFLSSVPRARYTLIGNEFWYMVNKDAHTLTWFEMAIFTQRRYTFETNRWWSSRPLD
jgi:hypothetical protein